MKDMSERIEEEFILLGPPGQITLYMCTHCGATCTATSVEQWSEAAGQFWRNYDGRPPHLIWHDRTGYATEVNLPTEPTATIRTEGDGPRAGQHWTTRCLPPSSPNRP